MQADQITAVVLSKAPFTAPETFPVGLQLVNSVQTFDTPAAMHEARLEAIKLVKTPWFFYLDDDDALPDNIGWILVNALAELEATKAKLLYTDEIVNFEGSWHFSPAAPYSQDTHLARPIFMHHLVLVNTEAAIAVLPTIPRGDYWTEMLLYWQVAKGGTVWFNHFGYIWNKGPDGTHTWPAMSIAQVASITWCAANR